MTDLERARAWLAQPGHGMRPSEMQERFDCGGDPLAEMREREAVKLAALLADVRADERAKHIAETQAKLDLDSGGALCPGCLRALTEHRAKLGIDR